jgi:hypothetical protein
MSHRSKSSFSVLLVAAIMFSFATAAHAGEGENSVTGFFKRLFNYPGKAVKGTADTAGHTLNNTGDKVLSQTGEHLSKGEVAEAVGQTVTGTAETAGQTVSETVQVPVQAAQEDADTAPVATETAAPAQA